MNKETPIGQGHGIAGRYGGLPAPYGSEEFAHIVLLPVAFDKTSTYQKGSDKGPAALIEASRNMELYDIETGSTVYLKGIYTAPPIVDETSEEMLEQVYRQVKGFLNKGKFVVTVGGEHSVSFAPIKAMAEHYGSLCVLQFDAHADLQVAYENNPWSHASVIARVKEIPSVTDVIAVGIRSMSEEEVPFQDQTRTFFAHEIADSTQWVDRMLDLLTSPVYVTIDLDVFDSSIMPSTGTPEPGGLSWQMVNKILKRVFMEKNVVGFDVVELLPRQSDPAPDYLAAKLIYKLLSYQFYEK